MPMHVEDVLTTTSQNLTNSPRASNTWLQSEHTSSCMSYTVLFPQRYKLSALLIVFATKCPAPYDTIPTPSTATQFTTLQPTHVSRAQLTAIMLPYLLISTLIVPCTVRPACQWQNLAQKPECVEMQPQDPPHITTVPSSCLLYTDMCKSNFGSKIKQLPGLVHTWS
jgi:hypothetical protein